jgi:hypothetical protein
MAVANNRTITGKLVSRKSPNQNQYPKSGVVNDFGVFHRAKIKPDENNSTVQRHNRKKPNFRFVGMGCSCIQFISSPSLAPQSPL